MSEQSEFTLSDRGFLDGLAQKEPSREFIRRKEYREGYEKGFWQYHIRLREITGGNNN